MLGVSVSRLLVRSALAGDVEARREGVDLAAQILGGYGVLAGLANNVNQLARWANTERAFPDDAEALVAEVRRALVSLEAAAERLAQL